MTDQERSDLRALAGEVRALGSKVDLLVERSDVAKTTSSDHENRIRSLERWKLALPASLVVTAGSIVAAALLH